MTEIVSDVCAELPFESFAYSRRVCVPVSSGVGVQENWPVEAFMLLGVTVEPEVRS